MFLRISFSTKIKKETLNSDNSIFLQNALMPRMTWIFQGRRGTPKRPPILMKIHRININTKPHPQLHEQVDRIKMQTPLGPSRTLMGGVHVFEKNLIYPPKKNSMGGGAKIENRLYPPQFIWHIGVPFNFFIIYLDFSILDC